ncbi:endolytic transglycosylase MltG [Candidatus Uhrbacteria bacterium]|nr:endolytic transglycosylase MltG [Candidatus Uhrbacteria bacterium]
MNGPIRHPQGILGYEQRRKRSPIVFAMLLMVVVLIGGVGTFAAAMFLPQDVAGGVRRVEISGTRADVVRSLRAAQVIRHDLVFQAALALQRRTSFHGQYDIDARASAWSIARLVTRTSSRREREIRVIEGWNLRDLGAYLEREGIATAAELAALAGTPAMDYRIADAQVLRPKDFSGTFAFLKEKPEFIGLEGYLFPNTYRVYVDASLTDILGKMLTEFDRKLTPELRQEITQSGRSLHQVLTMASIIEAEISRPEDRALASGILWKRRDRGMRLQVDSTVNYVTGKHDPRVTIADTGIDSAYNTYRYPGLPRGPINNPGMDAILAALRPKESPYWFFLTAPSGQTTFSRTLEEHQANSVKHLR